MYTKEEEEIIKKLKPKLLFLKEETILKVYKIQEETRGTGNFHFWSSTEKEAQDFIMRYRRWKGEFLKDPNEITGEQRNRITAARQWANWVFDGTTRAEAWEFIKSYEQAVKQNKTNDPDSVRNGHIEPQDKGKENYREKMRFKHKARMTSCFDCDNHDETCDLCPYKNRVNIYNEW